MEEDFYKVWTAEEYDKQPRGEGWLIMGDSHSEEEGPATAGDAEEAAIEWGKEHTLTHGPDDTRVVVVDDAGQVTRWTVRWRVEIRIDVEEDEGAS